MQALTRGGEDLEEGKKAEEEVEEPQSELLAADQLVVENLELVGRAWRRRSIPLHVLVEPARVRGAVLARPATARAATIKAQRVKIEEAFFEEEEVGVGLGGVEPSLHSCLQSSRLRICTLIKQVSRGKGAGNG